MGGTILVVLSVAILAELGWAMLPVALLMLLVCTGGLLHATERLLGEPTDPNL